VGEQSNAYRILLRYDLEAQSVSIHATRQIKRTVYTDRKSRHRRIKKRRRYERLAATSQFLTTYVTTATPLSFVAAVAAFVLLGYAAGRHDTLSGGSSPYLKQKGSLLPTP
jgi:hypothetical protein